MFSQKREQCTCLKWILKTMRRRELGSEREEIYEQM